MAVTTSFITDLFKHALNNEVFYYIKYNKYIVQYFVKCSSLDFISIANNELWTLMPEVNEMPRDILFTSCFNDVFLRL